MEFYNSKMEREIFHPAGKHLVEAFQEVISAAIIQGINKGDARLHRLLIKLEN